MGVEDVLERRYPNLSFLLRFTAQDRPEFPLHRDDVTAEALRATAPLPLTELELIYIYGIGLGYYYFPLKKWLAENPERDLVFIEENIEVLRAFLTMEHAVEILSHPQIHIRFNMDRKRLHVFLEECAYAFPFEKMAVIALASYKTHCRSRFYRMRLKLHRLTTVHHAIFLENSHYHLFWKNFLPNFQRLSSAFYGNALKDQFKNVPAIVCGAGPSLAQDIDVLKQLQNRALLLAGGSAITALSQQGILPHFGLAIDPNIEEFHRFQTGRAFEVPILYGGRLCASVFNTCNGPHGYMHTMTGGRGEIWIEDKLGIDPIPLQQGFDLEALSVTTTALQLACTLGCNPIILLGVDLAFTGGQIYTPGVVSDTGLSNHHLDNQRVSEKILMRQDIYGRPVETRVKWIMESQAISRFATHNRSFTFINATHGGIGFEQIPNQRLATLPLRRSYDLRALVHQAIETHPLAVNAEHIASLFGAMEQSAKQAMTYVRSAIDELERIRGHNRPPETGKLMFLQMELEALDAYTCFLQDPDRTYQTLFNRKYRAAAWNPPNYSTQWDFLYARWKAFEQLLQFYLRQFEGVKCSDSLQNNLKGIN